MKSEISVALTELFQKISIQLQTLKEPITNYPTLEKQVIRLDVGNSLLRLEEYLSARYGRLREHLKQDRNEPLINSRLMGLRRKPH